MRSFLPILYLACSALLCGFTIVTPEMVRERQEFCAKIVKRYGEKRLTAFVREVVTQHPIVGGARLTDSKVGDRWAAMDWNPFWHLISDDWAMAVRSNSKDADAADLDVFTLFWACDDEHGIFIEGRREASGKLVFESIRKEAIAKLNWE